VKKSLLLAALIVGVVSVIMNPIAAIGNHEPADKASAAASDMDTLGQGTETVLRQTMRVSSTSDLILQTTAECSILTSLFTQGSGTAGTSETDGSFGQVEMWIEIDGNRVPVATDDSPIAGEGEVVFCNRAYQRTVSDEENLQDGLDSEDDFIRTRTANAFNWMAFNVGMEYDDPNEPVGTTNNVVDIQVKARYTRQASGGDCGTRQADNALTPYGETCADAFVGSRSLIAEVVHASNHEQPDNGAE
jgi:hypothetical protein